MRMHAMAAAAAALLVTGTIALQAQDMPKPAPEMAQLAYFEGNWTCAGKMHETWDPASTQFVMFWFDSMGGFARSTSPGVKGNVMVYDGESQMGPMKMKSRDTFTKHADGTFTHAWAAEIGGAMTPMGEQTCKKN